MITLMIIMHLMIMMILMTLLILINMMSLMILMMVLVTSVIILMTPEVVKACLLVCQHSAPREGNQPKERVRVDHRTCQS